MNEGPSKSEFGTGIRNQGYIWKGTEMIRQDQKKCECSNKLTGLSGAQNNSLGLTGAQKDSSGLVGFKSGKALVLGLEQGSPYHIWKETEIRL